MSEQDWAEGSGSQWEDLNGDPRIVPGAEVLVGNRKAMMLPDEYRALLGSRGTVFSTDTTVFDSGDPAVGVRVGTRATYYNPRDLVCLRATSGELTEEGLVLERLSVGGICSLTAAQYQWLARAGIYRSPTGFDRRRLAMALGRTAEETP